MLTKISLIKTPFGVTVSIEGMPLDIAECFVKGFKSLPKAVQLLALADIQEDIEATKKDTGCDCPICKVKRAFQQNNDDSNTAKVSGTMQANYVGDIKKMLDAYFEQLKGGANG